MDDFNTFISNLTMKIIKLFKIYDVEFFIEETINPEIKRLYISFTDGDRKAQSVSFFVYTNDKRLEEIDCLKLYVNKFYKLYSNLYFE